MGTSNRKVPGIEKARRFNSRLEVLKDLKREKREFSEGRCFLEREGDASKEGDAIFMLMLTG